MEKKKKRLLIYGTAVLTAPFAVILLITAALYLPFVQNWAVHLVSDYASEETGMDIQVNHVSLAFPLNLSVEDISCVKQNDSLPRKDTILMVQRAVVNVQLIPLFSSDVKINAIELLGAKVNTSDFIHEARVKGTIGRLAIEHGTPVADINLADYGVNLSSAMLDNTHLNVELSDTVPEDTTQSENHWRIFVKNLSVTNTDVTLHMPGDTLQIGAHIGTMKAQGGAFDLNKGQYDLATIYANDSRITYDNNFEKYAPAGLDVNHIVLDRLCFHIDSIHYLDPDIRLQIRNFSFVEQSGIELKSLVADVAMDSTQIRVKASATTPASRLYTRLTIDMNAFDNSNPGHLQAFIDAAIGRQDLMMAMDGMPKAFKAAWPAAPLSIKGEAIGNLQKILIPGMSVDMPGVISLKLHGNAQGFMALADDIYSKDFSSQLHTDLKTYNLSFIKNLLDRNTARLINIPNIHSVADVNIHGAKYDIALKATEGKGTLSTKSRIDLRNMAYDADLKVNRLNLGHFVKGMGLGIFTGNINANGQGTDYTDSRMRMNATANISTFQYAKYNINNINAKANINNGIADVRLQADNEIINGDINLSAMLKSKNVKGTLATELNNLDLYKLHIIDVPMNFSLCGHIDLESDLNQSHRVNAMISDIHITDTTGIHTPADIVLDALTTRDTTSAHVYCGDFEMIFNARGGYEWLMKCGDRLGTAISRQLEARTIDQAELREVFPHADVFLRCEQDNPIYNFAKYFGIDFKEMYANVKTSRENGINGNVHIFGLATQGYSVDTITVNLASNNDPMDITYKAHIQNVKPNDYIFDAYIDGEVLEHGLSINGAFYDKDEVLGLKLGAEAMLTEEGIRFHLTPKKPVIAYEDFTLNDNNYIQLSKNNRIFADVKMKAPDGTGIQIYSTDEDNDAMQDITLSLNHLNIGKLLAVIPYCPHIEGMLDGDYHFIQDNDESFSVSTDMTVHNMIYEGCNIGNIGTQMVYMPKEDDSHYIDGHILLEDEEVGSVSGSYNFDTEAVNAKLEFIHFPMQIINGFIPDQIMGLEGFAEGELTVQGTTNTPNINGELFLESASLISVPYGAKLRFDDDPIRIANSKLLFENFQMYASNNEPLIARGELDFADLDHIKLDLRIKATNFLLVDAKESVHSEAYGKAYVNFLCLIQGELDKLTVRGKLDVLSSTNLYYILKDSPITTDNRLKELVTFTDFRTGEPIQVIRPTIGGINVNLSINIIDGAHVKCWLNTNHTNYLDLIGGGTLRMKYQNDNIDLRGRYTIHEGEMKYSLPVIPLKTFTISPDSYIEFTGDMMNPKLNITATERTKAACTVDGTERIVAFDCGVVITKTLNDMGLQFIIDAPEEKTISDQLTMMGLEERGKIAVTMLTTGMYLADGNTSNFSMNSALNSFLQAEINQIAGSALRTLDLSFGLDNSTEEDGTIHTDYTFKFAKRFWNNRLAISVGGKISTGSDASKQQNTFFDNIELQYRFSDTSNQYMNLFYKRSVYDYLEGYVGQYGAGYMYRKKLQRLSDLFRNTSTVPMQTTPAPTTAHKDTTANAR